MASTVTELMMRRMMGNRGGGIDWESVYSQHLQDALVNVTVPDGVTQLMNYAFERHSALVSVVLPNSLTVIKTSCFAYCTSLTTVTYNSQVTFAGQSSIFSNCTSITNIWDVLPSGIAQLILYMFSGCTGLKSVTIPSTITSMQNYVFNGCTGIEEMIFEGTAPPTIASQSLGSTSYTFPIYVPDSAVNTYKTAFSQYSSRIFSINDR